MTGSLNGASNCCHASRQELSVVRQAFVAKWIELVDRDDVRWQAEKIVDGCVIRPSEGIVDERFIDAALRAVHLPELLGEINEAAAAFTADELLARFQENGVASGPVHRRWDVHNDRQIKALDLIVEREVEGLGTLRQPRPMWHFGESKALVTSSMGRTGEHTLEVLRDAGLTEETIAGLLSCGAIAVPV